LNQRGIKAIIPPRKDAIIWQHGNNRQVPLARDENLRAIRKKVVPSGKKRSSTIAAVSRSSDVSL